MNALSLWLVSPLKLKRENAFAVWTACERRLSVDSAFPKTALSERFASLLVKTLSKPPWSVPCRWRPTPESLFFSSCARTGSAPFCQTLERWNDVSHGWSGGGSAGWRNVDVGCPYNSYGSLKPGGSDVCEAQRGGGTAGKLDSRVWCAPESSSCVEVSGPKAAGNASLIQRTFVVKKVRALQYFRYTIQINARSQTRVHFSVFNILIF